MDLFKTPSARELFAPESKGRESVWKIVFASMRRQKGVVAVAMALGMVIGIVRLTITPRQFETSCTVRVEALDMSQPGMEATASSLLSVQPQVMRSTEVIALAVASPDVHDLAIFQGKKRIDYVKSNFVVHSMGDAGIYELTLTSSDPAEAEKLLKALFDAYKAFQSSPDRGDDAPLAALRTKRQQAENDLASTRARLDNITKQQSALFPTPDARQRVARERAELLAAVVASGGKLDPQNPIRVRLDQLAKQAQTGDQLDDQAAQLQGEVERLTTLRDDLDEQLRSLTTARQNQLTTMMVTWPQTDPSPVAPKPWNVLAVCALVGLAGGIVLAVAVDQISDRINDGEDAVFLARAPIVGRVPAMSNDLSTSILRGQCVLVRPASPAAKACRKIGSAVASLMAAGIDKTILVTGMANSHGKSVVASNVAIVMAKAGQRVALVDINHRSPMVGKIFAIEDSVGLNTAIEGKLKVTQTLHVTGLKGLEILPVGTSQADWSELFNHPQFLVVLTELSEQFDRVIIDGGLSQSDETRIVSAFCDVTIMVVDARRCRRRQLKSAADGLRAVGARVAGIVLNDTPAQHLNSTTNAPNNAARQRLRPVVAGARLVETT